MLPFYQELELPVRAVLVDDGRAFCGTETQRYELSLALHEIEQCGTRVRTPRTKGFVEHLNGTVLDGFFRVAMREKA